MLGTARYLKITILWLHVALQEDGFEFIADDFTLKMHRFLTPLYKRIESEFFAKLLGGFTVVSAIRKHLE